MTSAVAEACLWTREKGCWILKFVVIEMDGKRSGVAWDVTWKVGWVRLWQDHLGEQER